MQQEPKGTSSGEDTDKILGDKHTNAACFITAKILRDNNYVANNSDVPITVIIMISLMIIITLSTLMEEMDYDGNSDIIIRKVLTLAITAVKGRRIISFRFTMNINEIDCDVRSQLY